MTLRQWHLTRGGHADDGPADLPAGPDTGSARRSPAGRDRPGPGADLGHGISSLIRPFGVLVIIGVLCGLASWSMGPAEGMRRVAADGHLNPWWGRTNRRGAPTMVLLLQATLGSLLALAMIFVNNINTYYWMLTALVAQTFLVMYFLMYISVVRLRITKPDAPRPFKIPGGTPGLALVVGIGVIGALFTFLLGFIPATHLSTSGTIAYVAVMAFGMLAIIGTPFLLHRGPSLKTDARPDPGLLAPATLSQVPQPAMVPAGRLQLPDRPGRPVWRDGRPISGRVRELGFLQLEFRRRHDGGVRAGCDRPVA